VVSLPPKGMEDEEVKERKNIHAQRTETRGSGLLLKKNCREKRDMGEEKQGIRTFRRPSGDVWMGEKGNFERGSELDISSPLRDVKTRKGKTKLTETLGRISIRTERAMIYSVKSGRRKGWRAWKRGRNQGGTVIIRGSKIVVGGKNEKKRRKMGPK